MSKVAASSLLITLLLLPACAEGPKRREFAPEDQIGPDAPRVNPAIPVETNSRSLVAITCTPDGQDGNHMDAKPASGCTNGVASDQRSRNGMEYFQRWRKHLGLPCVSTPDYAQAAAGWHSIYMARHAPWYLGHTECFMDGHSEKTGCEFFSGHTARDQVINHGMDTANEEWVGQVTGDGTLCKLEPHEFMAGMLAGPYHRLSMMRPQTSMAGYATFWEDHKGGETWTTTIQMTGPKFRSVNTPIPTVIYPVAGDSNVPRTFSGKETPTPPAPPGGWMSGYPVTILRPDTEFTGTAFCRVEADGSCTHVPHVALLRSSDPHEKTPANAAHIYAHHGLWSNTVYRAQFFGTSKGSDVAPWWEFRTKN